MYTDEIHNCHIRSRLHMFMLYNNFKKYMIFYFIKPWAGQLNNNHTKLQTNDAQQITSRFFRIYKSATRMYSKYLLIEGCDFITSKESLQANFIALIVIGSVQFDNSCHVMMSLFRFLAMTACCQRLECLSGPIRSE